MNDASTMQPPSTDAQTNGHGRHRGTQSPQDSEAAPHGRHRKPAEDNETTAA